MGMARDITETERFTNMTTVEKRKFPRLNLVVKVKYQVLKGYRGDKGAQSKYISVGGIRLTVPEKVDVDDLLRLTLSLASEDSPITVIGKVIWVEVFSVDINSDYKAYDCGIEFVDISPQDQEHISRYLLVPSKQ